MQFNKNAYHIVTNCHCLNKEPDGRLLPSGHKKWPFCLVRMDFYTVGTGTLCKNIRYISTTELKEVLNRNFGGGWGSLSRSIQNIILSNFDVTTVTLPKERLHKKGGFYEKKVKDGFEVFELEKGGWVEAIFTKKKSEQEDSDIHCGNVV